MVVAPFRRAAYVKREHMHPRLKRYIPSRETISQNRWLRWLGPRLMHHRLWHFSRRGVAIGAALGVFFGLIIPLAQIPLSAAGAVLMRANLPIAVASTLVTNPVTFAPVYVFAHQLGVRLLDDKTAVAPDMARLENPALQDNQAGWQNVRSKLLALGKPLLLGLAVLAVSASILTYTLIMLLWRLRIMRNWNRRKGRATAGN